MKEFLQEFFSSEANNLINYKLHNMGSWSSAPTPRLAKIPVQNVASSLKNRILKQPLWLWIIWWAKQDEQLRSDNTYYIQMQNL